MSFLVVYVTHPTEGAAKKVVNLLVEKHLIACGNIFPIRSAYWWKGQSQEEKEWVSLLKTTKERWPVLEQLLLNIHPYDVPCLMHWEVSANAAYEQWIHEEVAKSDQG